MEGKSSQIYISKDYMQHTDVSTVGPCLGTVRNYIISNNFLSPEGPKSPADALASGDLLLILQAWRAMIVWQRMVGWEQMMQKLSLVKLHTLYIIVSSIYFQTKCNDWSEQAFIMCGV